MDMVALNQSVVLTVAGMVVVFAFMGVLILVVELGIKLANKFESK